MKNKKHFLMLLLASLLYMPFSYAMNNKRSAPDNTEQPLAKRQKLTNEYDIDTRDARGNTQLHLAVHAGNMPKASYLINHGANVNALVHNLKHTGVTPLYIAVNRNNKDMTLLLLAYKANQNARANGWTPLHHAVSYNNASMTLLLLSQDKSKINSKIILGGGKTKGATSLHLAVQNNNTEIVQILINAHANVDEQMANGATPLHIAVQRGYMNIIDRLLNAGAQINIADRIGNTPLHYAALNGHKKIMQKLILTPETYIEAQNKSGLTAYDLSDNQANAYYQVRVNKNVHISDQAPARYFYPKD